MGAASPVKAVSGFAKFVHAIASVLVLTIVLFGAYSVWQYGLASSIAWLIDAFVQLLGDVSQRSDVVPDVPR
jgi:hypothetical protein